MPFIEKRIEAAVAVLRLLEDEERLEAMSEFCWGCGWEGRGCQCQNDE
jgi:hypothetical protein